MASKTRVLVGVHDGGFTGIDTYAEQVAIAGAMAGHDVTLLTSTPALARRLYPRLMDFGVRILDLGLRPLSPREIQLNRIWPGLALRRLENGLTRTLGRLGETFPVVQLNHPGLAHATKPFVARVCVAGWFYPHSLRGRVIETWRHGGGFSPRGLALIGKSVSHYANDTNGYRLSDYVLAPTRALARQLQMQGFSAVVCPPPVYVAPNTRVDHPTEEYSHVLSKEHLVVRLLICSGDLSHPRKNIKAALRALRLITPLGRQLFVEAIGRNADTLHSDVVNMPDNIHISFPGPLPATEVFEHMRRADALLFPSLFEEWGYVAVESLLCNTPVVTFPVYPFDDMLSPEFGARAHDLSVEAFALAIQQVLSDQYAANPARAARERFGSEVIGRRLTEIWTANM